ncbi:hypothetical protein VCR12J2_1360098 [Vibrio coralliirubri]|nr:hypothetical protein VCR12J2_1360098 [Vibrio coralliirubri]
MCQSQYRDKENAPLRGIFCICSLANSGLNLWLYVATNPIH